MNNCGVCGTPAAHRWYAGFETCNKHTVSGRECPECRVYLEPGEPCCEDENELSFV